MRLWKNIGLLVFGALFGRMLVALTLAYQEFFLRPSERNPFKN